MNISGTTEFERTVDPAAPALSHSKNKQHGSSKAARTVHLNPNATEFNPSAGPKAEHRGTRSQPDAARGGHGRRPNRGNKNNSRGGGTGNKPRGALSQSFRSSKAEQQKTDFDPASDGGLPLARSPNPNSRAFVQANHLLNFQYARGRSDGPSGRRPPHANRSWKGAPPRPLKYDKTKFIQANFRFLVSDAVDTSYYLADADRMFDWEDIIQVEMLSTIPVRCPISLESPPVCPQITPCGHIFSFHAIMHHLMNKGGEQLRSAGPCPLCFQPIVARELRYVVVREVTAPKVGDRIDFVALHRPYGSIIPKPVRGAEGDTYSGGGELTPRTAWRDSKGPSQECDDSALDLFASNRFAKFITAGSGVELWRPAAQELATYAAKVINEGGLEAEYEAPYIYAAMEQLGIRARNWGVRRAEQSESTGVIGAIETSSNETLKQGMALEAAVKQVFTAAMNEACKSFNSRVLRAAHEADFPSLAVAAQPSTTSSTEPSKSAKSTSEGSTTPRVGTKVPGQSGSGRADGMRPESRSKSSGSLATSPESKPDNNERRERGGRRDRGDRRGLDVIDQLPPEDDAVLGMVAGDSNADAEFHFQAAFSDDELGGEGVAPVAPSGSSFSSKSTGGKATVSGGQAFGASASPPSEGVDLLSQSPSTNPFNMTSHDGQYYMYQAADGQWLFLDPVNLKILAHYFGGLSSCPARVSGTILEIEDMVQLESTRKKLKFLSHLPLTGVFKFLEIDLSEHIPPEGLAPFQEELQMREKRRKRKAEQERKRKQKEASAAAARAAARLGPSEEELKSMPLPSASLSLAEDNLLTPEQLEEGLALQESYDNAPALGTSPQPESGVSFARITKMGYVARGPALGSSPPSPSVSLMGAWANKGKPAALSGTGTGNAQSAAGNAQVKPKGGVSSLASLLSASPNETLSTPSLEPAPFASAVAERENSASGKVSLGQAKKGKKVLLFSTASRHH